MNLVFDKDAYEKVHGSQTMVEGSDSSKANPSDFSSGEPVRKALLDSLVSGKVGALSVDPNYLDFEALECKYFRLKKVFIPELNLITICFRHKQRNR